MNVSLTPELKRFVAGKVKTGMYQTASEVVREALRTLQGRDEWDHRRAKLLVDLDRGLAELDRGEGESIRATDLLAERRNSKASRK